VKVTTPIAAALGVLAAMLTSHASPSSIWINEFHYDNSGTDLSEFVEVVAPASFTDLAAVRLTLYNGGDGRTYGGTHLLDSFSPGKTAGGLTFYSKTISGLQNGAPDGMSLDLNGDLLDFISYEGVFAASAGPAGGTFSTDVGVAELDATPAGGAIGLSGHGFAREDFVWTALSEATPGGLNAGQMLIPEPRPGALLTMYGLGLWFLNRRRQRTLSGCPSRRCSKDGPRCE
jgi:hypothetical protein